MPWVATALLVAASLAFVSWPRVLAELERRPWKVAATIGVLLPFIQLAIVAACDHAIARYVATRTVAFEDVVRARAATAALPFGAAASGGYFLWIKSAMRPRSTAAAFGCIAAGEIASLCLVTTASLVVLAGSHDALPNGRILVVCVGGFVAVMSAFVAASRLGSSSQPFVETLRALPLRVFVQSVLGRAIDISVLVFATWLAARAFGLPLPLLVVGVYVPLILLAGLLPLSVAGLGATQAGWLLFSDYAPPEHLLAFHLIWNASLICGRLLRGLPFLSRVQVEALAVFAPSTAPEA